MYYAMSSEGKCNIEIIGIVTSFAEIIIKKKTNRKYTSSRERKQEDPNIKC